jgi:hypothetical protein
MQAEISVPEIAGRVSDKHATEMQCGPSRAGSWSPIGKAIVSCRCAGPRQLRESLLLNNVASLSLAHRSSFC